MSFSIKRLLERYPETTRLALVLVLFFGVPSAVFGYLGDRATARIRADYEFDLLKTAKNTGDIVDRNLFERYGDVQAFGINRAVLDRANWYKADAESPLVAVIDRYVDTYDIYTLSIVVDLEGKVIAVNSRDAKGRPISSSGIYAKNFAGAEWFRALEEERYTDKQRFTAEGNDTFSGTYIEDVHVDKDVLASYPGGDARTIGFSAPIRDERGAIIAYWTNRATFGLVDEILGAIRDRLVSAGKPDASVTLLSGAGKLVATHGPAVEVGPPSGVSASSKAGTFDAESNPVVREALSSLKGVGRFTSRNDEPHLAAFHHLVGVLGYPGMDWIVLVSLPEAPLLEMTRQQTFGLLVLLALALPAAFVFLRRTKRGEDLRQRLVDEERRQKAETERVSAIVENSPSPTMLLDLETMNIAYANTASLALLKRLEKFLPTQAGSIVGASVDIFHKNPSHQRRLLADPKNLPHRARVTIGDEIVDLNVYALRDSSGKYIAPALQWDVVTEQAALEKRDADAKRAVEVVRDALRRVAAGDIQVAIDDDFGPELNVMRDNVNGIASVLRDFNRTMSELAAAAAAGRLQERADASGFRGAYAEIASGVNRTLDAILAPVNDIREKLASLATGDLTAYVDANYEGDHAELKNALNSSLDGLNALLGQLSGAIGQIGSSSAQVAAAAQDLSQGASEQAATTEEISAQMSQLTTQTQQNAENASLANQLALSARDGARAGDSRMNEMLGAMREIETASNNISKIIKVIDEIAFQTNLLALNAAVEAARAGVHGKGFAVVAEEVRNLAARSARAAKETTEMIEGTIQKVALGTGIAQETATALGSIVQSVGKVTDLVAEIAAASSEQADGINQINAGLDQVNLVTQRNTATAEQSAASAEETSTQVAGVQRLVSRFTLAEGRGGLGATAGMTPEMMSVVQAYVDRLLGGGRSHSVFERRTGPPRPVTATLPTKSPIDLDSPEFGKY